MNRPLKPIAAGLAAALCLPPAVVRSEDRPFADLVPDTTAVFLCFPDARALGEAFRQTQAHRLWADPTMQPFVQRAISSLDHFWNPVGQPAGPRLVEVFHLPVGQTAVVVGARAMPDRSDGRWPADAMALVDVGPRVPEAQRVVAALEARSRAAGAVPQTHVCHGVTITEWREPALEAGPTTRPRRPTGWAWFLDGSLLGVAHQAADLRDVLQARAGDRPFERSLAELPRFQRVLDRVGRPAQAYAYVNLPQLGHVLSGLMADQAGLLELVMHAFGVDLVEACGAGLSFSQGEFDGVLKATVLLAGSDRGLPKMFHLPSGEVSVEPFVPATAAGYFTLHWDLPGFYDELKASLDRVDPRLGPLLELMLRQGLGLRDFNVRDEIVQALDGRISLYRVYQRPLTFSSATHVLAVRLAKADRFRAGLKKLLDALPGGVRTRQVGPRELFLVGDETSGRQTALAVTDSYVIISPSPELVEEAVRRAAADPATGLAGTAAFQRVRRYVPAGVSGFAFYDFQRIGEFGHHLSRTNQLAGSIGFIGTMLGRDGRRLAQLLDGSDLPPFEAVRPYFGVVGGYLTVDREGLTLTHFSLRPPLEAPRP